MSHLWINRKQHLHLSFCTTHFCLHHSLIGGCSWLSHSYGHRCTFWGHYTAKEGALKCSYWLTMSGECILASVIFFCFIVIKDHNWLTCFRIMSYAIVCDAGRFAFLACINLKYCHGYLDFKHCLKIILILCSKYEFGCTISMAQKTIPLLYSSKRHPENINKEPKIKKK